MTKEGKERAVCWFDFDSALTVDIAQDIGAVGSVLPQESFVFITINAEYNRTSPSVSKPADKYSWFQDNFSSFILGLDKSHFEKDNFRKTIGKVLLRVCKNAFAGRGACEFVPLVQSFYKDTSWMCTVGGVIDDPSRTRTSSLVAKIRKWLPDFGANLGTEDFIDIPQLNLTEIERHLLDIASTQLDATSAEKIAAAALGFDSEFISRYRSVLRFVPRFIEASI